MSRPLLQKLWLPGLVFALAWGARHPRIPASPILTLLLLALAIGAQLVPLAADQLTGLSPHAIEILGQRNLTFSLGASLSYPLSIDPPRTPISSLVVSSL